MPIYSKNVKLSFNRGGSSEQRYDVCKGCIEADQSGHPAIATAFWTPAKSSLEFSI